MSMLHAQAACGRRILYPLRGVALPLAPAALAKQVLAVGSAAPARHASLRTRVPCADASSLVRGLRASTALSRSSCRVVPQHAQSGTLSASRWVGSRGFVTSAHLRLLAPDAPSASTPAATATATATASTPSSGAAASSANITAVAEGRVMPSATSASLTTSQLRARRASQPVAIPRYLTSPLPPLREWPAFVLNLVKKLGAWSIHAVKVLGNFTLKMMKQLVTDPKAAVESMSDLWQSIKHEVHHFWVGSKLFATEVNTSAALVRRVGRGESLTRRERMQLKRAISDVLRMVPFIVIVIIPFAELGLPVLLKLFPNMLPSQFEKADYRQESYRKSLNVKLELHGILQEVVQERVARNAAGGDAQTVDKLFAQLEDVRTGKKLPADTIVKVAKMFKDDITLENLPRGQLAALAKYIGISPFAPEPLLRYQLQFKMRNLRDDDKDVVREGGTAALTKQELQQACEARGMRAVGLSEWQLRGQLDDWLELSVDKQVPMTLLLLSRAFQIAQEPSLEEGAAEKALQESISSIDSNILKEVVLAQSSSVGGDTPQKAAVLEMKLEAIALQNELIRAEREAKESEKELEAAMAEASKAATAVQEARADPAHASDIDKLVSEAQRAQDRANEMRAVAAAKHDVVAKMRAVDVLEEEAAAAPAETAAAITKATPAAAAPAPGAPTTAASEEAAAASAKAAAKSLNEDIAALQRVVSGATVAREQEFLERMKNASQQIAAADALAKGRIGASALASGDDKTTAYLRSQLDVMLRSIEKELERLRSNMDLKRALQSVDKNQDGSVSAAEIDEALRTIIGTAQTDAAAAALIRFLDSDKDGVVSVDQLNRFLEMYAERVARLEAERKEAEQGGDDSPSSSSSSSSNVGGGSGAGGSETAASGRRTRSDESSSDSDLDAPPAAPTPAARKSA